MLVVKNQLAQEISIDFYGLLLITGYIHLYSKYFVHKKNIDILKYGNGMVIRVKKKSLTLHSADSK